MQIAEVVARAHMKHPDFAIKIVAHKSDPELKARIMNFDKVSMKAGESEMKSIRRLSAAKCFYIVNFYTGFVGGLPSIAEVVYYPPNLMYGIFGLASKYNRCAAQHSPAQHSPAHATKYQLCLSS